MDEHPISLVISVVAFLMAVITFYLWNKQSNTKKPGEESFNTRPLQLQAYERLVMLAERIALPNLISRNNRSDLSALEMQMLLLESLKQEYEHNISQQIYVTPAAWDTINKLKDQNMLIINQVAATLPPEAKGIDLNRKLLDFIMNNPNNSLHTIVLKALNFEAKKLMK